MITTAGKAQILRFVAGQVDSIAGSIAVGIGETPAALTDRRLRYEFDRADVLLSGVDFVNQKVVFKATLPQESLGVIYEVGLWSGAASESDNTSGMRVLVNFDSTETWPAGVFNSTNSRVGLDSLRLTAAASTTTVGPQSIRSLDLSEYSSTDFFTWGVFTDANTETVGLRLYSDTDTASYYQYTFTPTAGYNIVNFSKTNFTKVGTVDWSKIGYVAAYVTAKSAGSTTVDFDGLKIEREDLDTGTNILVARTIVSPKVKDGTSPLDIEYPLDFSI